MIDAFDNIFTSTSNEVGRLLVTQDADGDTTGTIEAVGDPVSSDEGDSSSKEPYDYKFGPSKKPEYDPMTWIRNLSLTIVVVLLWILVFYPIAHDLVFFVFYVVMDFEEFRWDERCLFFNMYC